MALTWRHDPEKPAMQRPEGRALGRGMARRWERAWCVLRDKIGREELTGLERTRREVRKLSLQRWAEAAREEAEGSGR